VLDLMEAKKRADPARVFFEALALVGRRYSWVLVRNGAILLVDRLTTA